MRKFWLLGFALGLGLISTEAFAQQPVGYSNYGPSSYPVSPQSILQNAPQVPQNYNPQMVAPHQYAGQPVSGPPQFQLVGTQEQMLGGQPPMVNSAPHSVAPMQTQMQNHVPAISPQPIIQNQAIQSNQAPAAGCQSCTQPNIISTPAPTTMYTQPMAAGSSCATGTCGPITQGYSMPTTTYSMPAVAASGSSISKPWFFGANVLSFNRIDDKSQPLSFFDSAYSPDVLTTRDARHGAAPGVEAFFGRYFNCGRNAIQFSYWGIFPDDEAVTRARPTAGDYRSRIPFQYMTMAGTPAAPATPYPVYDWYDNAFTHSISRSSEYHNFEVNLLGFAAGGAARNFNRSTAGSFFSGTRNSRGSGCGYCGGAGCGSCASSCNTCKPAKFATGPCCLVPPSCGSRLNLTWLAGFRYFRFNDDLLYAASLDDSIVNRAADDLYYEVNTTNDLAGFQTGGRIDYCVGKKINAYGFTKVGVYNNRSNLYTRIGTDFDNAYLDDTRTPANPNNGADYVFDETKDSVAFLSEIGTGFGYRVSSKWTGTFGYRAVIATNVATAVGNVRTQFANYDDVRDYDNYGTLVLHGFTLGAVYNY